MDENGEPVNAEDTNHKLNEIEARKIVKEELEPLEKDIDKHIHLALISGLRYRKNKK